ncbi:hypothetical protein [Lacticaseibacillus jixiensis]|uniref:hypothetical protein n=1 Tax=Lacticaseibacillus jixiensis TaxID=3231926 RepID=UPI0036F3D695
MSWIKIKFYALSKQYPLSELMANITDNFAMEFDDGIYTKLRIDAAFPATKRHAANVICTITCVDIDEDFADLDVHLYNMTDAYPIEYNELDEHESFEWRSGEIDETEDGDNGNNRSD